MPMKTGAMLNVWLSPKGTLTVGLNGAAPPTAATEGAGLAAADPLAAAEAAAALGLAAAEPLAAAEAAALGLAAADALAGADGAALGLADAGGGLLAAGDADGAAPQAATKATSRQATVVFRNRFMSIL